ncbi:hypothetical protein OFB78_29010 [Escherichia coli]|nr:hypothetical protein [Escherichia coli]
MASIIVNTTTTTTNTTTTTITTTNPHSLSSDILGLLNQAVRRE